MRADQCTKIKRLWGRCVDFDMGVFFLLLFCCLVCTKTQTTTTTTSTETRAQAVAKYWSAMANKTRGSHHHHQQRVSWWQSPVIMAEVRRRVSGNESTTFAQYFKSEIVVKKRAGKPFVNALSLGSGHGKIARSFHN